MSDPLTRRGKRVSRLSTAVFVMLAIPAYYVAGWPGVAVLFVGVTGVELLLRRHEIYYTIGRYAFLIGRRMLVALALFGGLTLADLDWLAIVLVSGCAWVVLAIIEIVLPIEDGPSRARQLGLLGNTFNVAAIALLGASVEGAWWLLSVPLVGGALICFRAESRLYEAERRRAAEISAA